MAIPQTFIDELLARVDIVDVIEQRIPLRKRGGNYVACCPFHNEKTPSFTVSQSKQIYHCFGCSASGNAISFLMNYEHLSFTETIEQLAVLVNMPLPEQSQQVKQKSSHTHLHQLLAEVTHHYQKQLRQHPEAQQAIAYLKQRGLTGTIAKTYAIGYSLNAWDDLLKNFPGQQELLLSCGMLIKNDKGRYYDRFRGRIMFPIRNRRGHIIGFGGRIIEQGEPKYLNSPESPIFHKGTELYGFYEACQANRYLDRLVIVEGYLDVIALAQYGITNAVATLGTATTAEHLNKLFRHTKELVFCFDGDQAGHAAAWKALELVLPFMEDGRHVRFLLLPKEHDPDSYIRAVGTDSFAKQVASATSLADFLFDKLTQNIDIESPAGKAQLIKNMAERLTLLPKGSLQYILIEQLAKVLRISTAALQNMLQDSAKAVPVTPTLPQQPAAILNMPSLVRHAITILIQHPQLASQLQIQSSLATSESKGSTFLAELISLLKQNPQLTTGALLEHWRDHAYSKQLKSLVTRQLNIAAEDLLTELQATLQRLSEEQQFQALWQKYQRGILSQAEKSQLLQLLQTQKRGMSSE